MVCTGFSAITGDSACDLRGAVTGDWTPRPASPPRLVPPLLLYECTLVPRTGEGYPAPAAGSTYEWWDLVRLSTPMGTSSLGTEWDSLPGDLPRLWELTGLSLPSSRSAPARLSPACSSTMESQ